MIHKEDLLKKLKEALVTEEQSIPIYAKHLDSAVFWAGWDEATTKKVKDAFRNLADESERHKILIENLIEKIKKDKRDAF